MNRLFVIAGALALGAIVTGAAVRADDKDISIKEIMTKAHKGGDAYLAKARNAAKEKTTTRCPTTPRSWSNSAKTSPRPSRPRAARSREEADHRLQQERRGALDRR